MVSLDTHANSSLHQEMRRGQILLKDKTIRHHREGDMGVSTTNNIPRDDISKVRTTVHRLKNIRSKPLSALSHFQHLPSTSRLSVNKANNSSSPSSRTPTPDKSITEVPHTAHEMENQSTSTPSREGERRTLPLDRTFEHSLEL